MIRLLLKSLLICLLISLTANTCFGQYQHYNNIKTWNIKGKADSIINISSDFSVKKDSARIRRATSRSVSFFDKNGFFTEALYYPSQSNQDAGITDHRPLRNVNSPDSKGNLSQVVYYSVTGIPYTKEVYTFDSLKSMVVIKIYAQPANVLTMATEKKLDKNGNVVDISSYNNSGQLFYKQTYKYNDKGHCVEDVEIRPKIQKEFKTLRTFDNDGNMIKETYYNGLGQVSSTSDYSYAKYDEKHNWVIRNTYRDGHLINVTERIIDYRK